MLVLAAQVLSRVLPAALVVALFEPEPTFVPGHRAHGARNNAARPNRAERRTTQGSCAADDLGTPAKTRQEWGAGAERRRALTDRGGSS